MNNFKHILHNIHLQYKHKIIVFKILDYSYHDNRNCQKPVYFIAKKITKNGICPGKNVKLTLFRLAFVKQVLLITLVTRSVSRPKLVLFIILVKNEIILVKNETCHLYYWS